MLHSFSVCTLIDSIGAGEAMEHNHFVVRELFSIFFSIAAIVLVFLITHQSEQPFQDFMIHEATLKNTVFTL